MSKGFLLVVSGPSGSGKSVICRNILKRNKKLIFSVSATTRKPRKGEIEGVNYFFVDKTEFQNMVEGDEFLEYANVHGNLYGTPKDFVFKKVQEGEIVILEIDVQGALQVKKSYPEAVFIFLLPPSMRELKKRIKKRGSETKKDIDIRMKNAFRELEFIDEYDYIVINDEIEEAITKIEAIIKAEKLKVRRLRNIIEKLLNKEDAYVKSINK